MKPTAFEYHAPTTVNEALALLAEHAPNDGRILAGGQSLVPTMAFRLARPTHLIDINQIVELEKLSVEDGALCIGATVRHATFHTPVCDGVLGDLLTEVVNSVAHYPIRQRGTFCGSLAHSDPASEWCMVAATLDATMIVQSASGERAIPADEFFDTVMTTTLNDDELLREVRIPLLSNDSVYGFQEFSRRAGDFAISMTLVTYRLEAGKIVDPHLGVGGAEDRPRRIAEAEAALAGQIPSDNVFRAAADAAAAAIDPMEDHATNAQYRRELTATLVRRALENTVS